MTALGPGVLVRCVDDSPRWDGEPSRLARGVLYTVLEVVVDGKGVTLVEVDPAPWDGWYINRFTPIDDTALDVFRTTDTDLPKEAEVA